MHITQRDGQQSLDTLRVWYEGTEELLPGYCVCYDPTVSTTDGSDGWNEKVRGRVVAKPATANLRFFAGVVVDPPRKNGDASGTYKGWCTIAKLRQGTWMKVLTKADADPNLILLKVVDGSFALESEASTGTSWTVDTLAVAGEVADTSSTAAVKLVMGIKG